MTGSAGVISIMREDTLVIISTVVFYGFMSARNEGKKIIGSIVSVRLKPYTAKTSTFQEMEQKTDFGLIFATPTGIG